MGLDEELDVHDSERSRTQDNWIISSFILICSYPTLLGLLNHFDIKTDIIPGYLWMIFAGLYFFIFYNIIDRFYVKNRFYSHSNPILLFIELPIHLKRFKMKSSGVLLNVCMVICITIFLFNFRGPFESGYEWWASTNTDSASLWNALIFMTVSYIILLPGIVIISTIHIPLLMAFSDTFESEADAYAKIQEYSLNELLIRKISPKEKISFLKQYSVQGYDWGVKVAFSKFKQAVESTWKEMFMLSQLVYISTVAVIGMSDFTAMYWYVYGYLFCVTLIVGSIHQQYSESVVKKMIINRCAEIISLELDSMFEEE
jgi:hypothetical protein